ncbi:SRPBCC domain-containing protein [Asticcacaulis sp. EMRT-3]|uniref:SRPBCC domain-containing protein n=1 Tax=Asticcacaulis sp. EMRT-3 TaxID=3040349 RepID=UPI0024AEE7DB|nr:SRPBCC domain-containing protein [Asticcacaulis sp. EMRT-3]MDI7775554.1 SRPBCC domain-containing protein [Asticcacaulis sp. EMRT-3]
MRSANPDTFAIERNFGHSLKHLFWAFATLEAKRKWFGNEDTWEVEHHLLDFRPGGSESWYGRQGPDAPWMRNIMHYYDILPDERIIVGYSVEMDSKLITVSQQVLEFTARGAGSRLRLTEQILYLDGHDHPQERFAGTQGILTALDHWLASRL